MLPPPKKRANDDKRYLWNPGSQKPTNSPMLQSHHLSPTCLHPGNTDHTPWRCPTLILELRSMGQGYELPTGTGKTSPFVAWKTLFKRADTIVKLTGVCLLLKSPDLATAREGIWHRHKLLGESDLRWLLEPGTVCPPSEALSARKMGKQPGPSQVRGCIARAVARCHTRCQSLRSTGPGLRRLSTQRRLELGSMSLNNSLPCAFTSGSTG